MNSDWIGTTFTGHHSAFGDIRCNVMNSDWIGTAFTGHHSAFGDIRCNVMNNFYTNLIIGGSALG